MTGVHVAVGVLVLVLFAAAAAWGGWRWWNAQTSDAFWRLLRAAQLALLVQVALGGVLLLTGRRPADELHYVYGLLPIAVSFVSEQLRISAAESVLDARDIESARAVGELPEAEQRSVVLAIVRREMGVSALSAAVITGLVLRAAFTSGGF